MSWDFLGIFHFGLDLKIPGDLKSPRSPVKNTQKILRIGDIFKWGGGFIPGIWKFLKSADFYPENWGFLPNPGYICGIYIPGIGDFLRIFNPGISCVWPIRYGDFSGMGFFPGWNWISQQKATCFQRLSKSEIISQNLIPLRPFPSHWEPWAKP